ncbi:hypothetical protein [Salmonirosea aquatica]|uniref:Uncharacterized protein n=1 Tax=Salmonirosea aquatica TaxID=2654236 RepID=A0A7C9F5S7_9BACT|nr:hypothetical protein [Cytophagaceae bacterium SJW1-29]
MAIRKFNHKEAFCLMIYQNMSDFRMEDIIIWNSRDGVTPFIVFHEGHEYQHVDWHRDMMMIDPEFLKERILLPGKHIFRDITKEEATEAAKKRIAQFFGTEFEIQKGSKRYDEVLANLIEDFEGGPKLVVLDDTEIARFGDLSNLLAG